MAGCHRQLNKLFAVFLVVCWLCATNVRAHVGTPPGKSGAKLAIPPLPPIISSGTFNSTHGEVNTTDIYGIKTYTNQEITYKMIVADVTDYVCGSKSICNRTQNDSINRPPCIFECSECKCDEKCHFYGDCCTGKLFEFSSSVPSIRHDFVTCSGAEDIKWGGQSHIFMVRKCPETSLVDTSSRLQCGSPDLSRLSEATPVSDPSTQVTYANKFCAACHGVQEYHTWGVQTRCPFVKTLSRARTGDELWRLVMADKSCTKEFLPPPNLEVRECYPYTHGSCNVTGKWVEHISPLTETLCNLYDHTVDYYGATAVPVTYKNVFCAICNGASLRFTPVCRRTASAFPVGLSILLHFKSTVEEKSSSSSPCPPDEIYDPFSETCQNLTCPTRMVLIDGECRSPYVSCSGIRFSYEQELRMGNGSVMNSKKLPDDYVGYFKGYFTEFGRIVPLDLEFNFYVKRKANSIDVNVMHVAGKFMLSSADCTVEDIEWRIKRFLSMPWIFKPESNACVSTHTPCSFDTQGYRLSSMQNYHYDVTPWKMGLMGSFFPIDLDCPFLEYDMSAAKFTFYSSTSTLLFEGQEISLNRSGLSLCNNTLKICSNVVQEITEILNSKRTKAQSLTPTKPEFPLLMVAIISVSLSLVCTFVILVTISLVFKDHRAQEKRKF